MSLFNIDYCFAEEIFLTDSNDQILAPIDEYNRPNAIPSNPFELVDLIKKINFVNDATLPSDAIDKALKDFDYERNGETD
tara:strand:- start:2115 stop:2354 length:240 start_codon:yes stop_codon:yes gene_type:complete